MKENIFELTIEQLKDIAKDLQTKIDSGLQKDNTEISCLPTFINPPQDIPNGKTLVLDWGGTNFRAAIVEFKAGEKPTIIESKKKPLSAKETAGFSREDLFREMSDLIGKLEKLDRQVTSIGYCFSYPAESTHDGDAVLLRWTKGIDIQDMIGKPVGNPLVNYLNSHLDHVKFETIKVINDTVACMFGGCTLPGYNTYIGLIVGTGTNMAALMDPGKIGKIGVYKTDGTIPVNLESGNFYPPFLITIDNLVDAMSNNKGAQRFEKAISGGYLGEIFKTAFLLDKINYKFDAEDLTNIISDPEKYPEKYAPVARWIYDRSAKLVAASIVGLILSLASYDEKTASHDESIKEICLAAEGGLFSSKTSIGKNYKEIVEEELKTLLAKFDCGGIRVEIVKMDEINLIGSAIAALS